MVTYMNNGRKEYKKSIFGKCIKIRQDQMDWIDEHNPYKTKAGFLDVIINYFKKMKFPKLHNFNEMFTPPEAVDYIEPFLDKRLVYWEACYGEGHLAEELKRRGFNVIGNKYWDIFEDKPKFDFLITNPPFNGNKKFIKQAMQFGKPFALLIRLEHLGGVEACKLLKDFDFQIITPEKRINYITPKSMRGEKVGGSPFHSIWLTHHLNLPKQINYENKKKLSKNKKQNNQ